MNRPLQRLAFRVRPEIDETFDSWLNRLLSRHEVDLRDLLRHLGCDPRLAEQWLGGGHKNVRHDLHDSYEHFLDMVAWAVDAEKLALIETVAKVPTKYLLPVACQHYGCLVCWMEALRSNRPLVIRTPWTYRLSWLCHTHDIPLHSIQPLQRLRTSDAQTQYLSNAIGLMRAWIAKVRVLRRAKYWNKECVDLLDLSSTPPDQRNRDVSRYFELFAENRFHVSPARIQLMALAHRISHREALRFDNFLRNSDRALDNRRARNVGATGTSEALSVNTSDLALLMKQADKTYEAKLSDLLIAYTAVRQRSPVLKKFRPRYSQNELDALRRSATRG